MSIAPLQSSRATRADSSAISDAVSQASGNQALDQNAFLKLLSTQLSNQDPLSPQDDAQFMAQLAQFSTVQGVNNLQTSQTHLQAAEMIGKTIKASVTLNNQPQNISGKVASVSWTSSGVNLTLDDKNQTVISLDQVTQVSQ